MKQIVASIIAVNQEELDKRFLHVKHHISRIQLDVMDNHFVSNSSMQFDFKIKDYDGFVEAHLMMQHPEQWVQKHRKNVNLVIGHLEAIEDVPAFISLCRKYKLQVGLALNPETPVQEVEPFIKQIDLVLIMTVHPGAYGSAFLPEQLDKVKYLHKKYPSLDIETDGGMTDDTLRQASDAGASLFSVGSHLQKSHHLDRTIKDFEKKIA